MPAQFTVTAAEDDDGETVTVTDAAGAEIARIRTAYDCPEDNTVSRLNLVGFARLLLRAAGATAA